MHWAREVSTVDGRRVSCILELLFKIAFCFSRCTATEGPSTCWTEVLERPRTVMAVMVKKNVNTLAHNDPRSYSAPLLTELLRLMHNFFLL
jgi:hypothetical protein